MRPETTIYANTATPHLQRDQRESNKHTRTRVHSYTNIGSLSLTHTHSSPLLSENRGRKERKAHIDLYPSDLSWWSYTSRLSQWPLLVSFDSMDRLSLRSAFHSEEGALSRLVSAEMCTTTHYYCLLFLGNMMSTQVRREVSTSSFLLFLPHHHHHHHHIHIPLTRTHINKLIHCTYLIKRPQVPHIRLPTYLLYTSIYIYIYMCMYMCTAFCLCLLLFFRERSAVSSHPPPPPPQRSGSAARHLQRQCERESVCVCVCTRESG